MIRLLSPLGICPECYRERRRWYVTVTDVSPYTRKADRGISGVARRWEQTSDPRDGKDWACAALIDVPTVAAAGTGAMADRADARERTGCSAVTGTVSESVLFTHHQLHQRLLLLGAKARGFRCEEVNLIQGNQPMNTLSAVLTIFTGASFVNTPHSPFIELLNYFGAQSSLSAVF